MTSEATRSSEVQMKKDQCGCQRGQHYYWKFILLGEVFYLRQIIYKPSSLVKHETNNGLNRIAELSCFGGTGSRESRTRDIFVQDEVLSESEEPHAFSF